MTEISFDRWMHIYSGLAEGSIIKYVRIIGAFTDKFKDPTIENINRFISEGMDGKSNYAYKFAFKCYLQYLGRPDEYKLLRKVKVPMRKSVKPTRPLSELLAIARSIRNEKYRDMAILQFSGAVRYRGIITMHQDRIDFDYEPQVIQAVLHEKGGREAPVFFIRTLEPVIRKYCGHGYLFLPKEAAGATAQDFERLVSNEYRYYLHALTEAAEEHGIKNLGTHAFKRNQARAWRKAGRGDEKIQAALHHSSFRTSEKYLSAEADAAKDLLIDMQREHL